MHSGQVCSAGARLAVEESIAQRFVDDLVARAEGIRLGGPFDEDAETGPLISDDHRDKVHAYVEQARADLQRAIRAGEPVPGERRLRGGADARPGRRTWNAGR